MSDENKPPEDRSPPEENPEEEPSEEEENPEGEPPEERKVVSLDRELAAIALVSRSGQILAELGTCGGYLDESMEEDSPHCIASVQALVGARLELVRRVIRREVDPAILWGPHNAVRGGESRFDGDVFLAEWNRA